MNLNMNTSIVSANESGYKTGLTLKGATLNNYMLKFLATIEGYLYDSEDYIEYINGVLRGSTTKEMTA